MGRDASRCLANLVDREQKTSSGLSRRPPGSDNAPVVRRLEKLFAAVLAEARDNSAFARTLEEALSPAAAEAPKPPPRKRAVLDPFKVYEMGWESMLSENLGRLDAEQLHDVIHQFDLDPRNELANLTKTDKLRERIVSAVLKRQKNL